MKISIATRELASLTKNGGIGTAMELLAVELASLSHEVSIFYTGKPKYNFFTVKKKFNKKNIQLVQIFSPYGMIFKNPYVRSKSLYGALKKKPADICLFHEYTGEAWDCIKNKIEGRSFQSAQLGIITHGSTSWVAQGNGQHLAENDPLNRLEHKCCRHADFLVSPSRYLLEWMKAEGWILPEKSVVIPNFVKMPAFRRTDRRINELVFFGRLEERKGVKIFCDALRQIAKVIKGDLKVTFLGKEDTYTEIRIRNLLAMMPALKLQFLKSLDSVQAVSYLARSQSLAIMPSLQENSPCAVAECLQAGIPFLATNKGGGIELAAECDGCFIEATSTGLAAAIQGILLSGVEKLPQPAFSNAEISHKWQTLLNQECCC